MFLSILRVLFCLLLTSYVTSEENQCSIGLTTCSDSEMSSSVDFEVFGRVQGVFFRKYTADKANQLGLKGYVMNTYSGTVVGTVEGPSGKVSEMKQWLQYTGSPSSRIDRCEFRNEGPVSSFKYSNFRIRH